MVLNCKALRLFEFLFGPIFRARIGRQRAKKTFGDGCDIADRCQEGSFVAFGRLVKTADFPDEL